MQRLLQKGIGHTEFKSEKIGLGLESEIPVNWKVSKLGKLCDVVRGGSPRPAGDKRFFGGNIPWITVGELTKDQFIDLTFVTSYLTEEGKKRSRFLNKNTVVLANSGATLGVPKILRISGCINDGVAAFLNLKEELDYLFLYFVLNSWINLFRNINQGMGQPNLNTTIIANIDFPVPPLKEQQRIASILSNVDDLIQKLQDKKKNEENLKKGLMQQLLTGKIRAKV